LFGATSPSRLAQSVGQQITSGTRDRTNHIAKPSMPEAVKESTHGAKRRGCAR
jgi:hypothetical protein